MCLQQDCGFFWGGGDEPLSHIYPFLLWFALPLRHSGTSSSCWKVWLFIHHPSPHPWSSPCPLRALCQKSCFWFHREDFKLSQITAAQTLVQSQVSAAATSGGQLLIREEKRRRNWRQGSDELVWNSGIHKKKSSAVCQWQFATCHLWILWLCLLVVVSLIPSLTCVCLSVASLCATTGPNLSFFQRISLMQSVPRSQEKHKKVKQLLRWSCLTQWLSG